MQKICEICNAEFEATRVFTKYCPDCRLNAYRDNTKIWQKNNPDKIREARRRKYLVEVFCATCGEKLPNGKQVFCLNCLLKDYKYNYSQKAAARLCCRGFNSKEIWDMIKERGI